MNIPNKHTENCNWVHYFEGTRLDMEVIANPDDPSIWVHLENTLEGFSEGMHMSANFCPQCGVNLREVK
jgi:hypothetical protein